MAEQANDAAKQIIDVTSVGVTMAVLLDYLPQAAALLTVLWLGARLYNEIMTAVYRRRDALARRAKR